MPLVQESHDSLPYIEPDITAAERGYAAQEIAKELQPGYLSTVHSSMPPVPSIQFSDLIEQELARKAAGLPMHGGIDTSRYEAVEPPATDPTSDEDRPEIMDAWRDSLRKAYAASTHLRNRLTNLALLEKFGKNAWLVGNSQLEAMLRTLEKELVEVREQTDGVNKARKRHQEDVRDELETLNESWRERIGRVIEAEAASELLRQTILQQRRKISNST